MGNQNHKAAQMSQGVLWHDSIYNALDADIAAAGGFKTVSHILWPAKDEGTATKTLQNATNPDQSHKLCPEEVLHIKRLAAAKGSYATVTFEARELSLEFTQVDPEDELQTALSKFDAKADAIMSAIQEVRRAKARAGK